MFYPKPGHLFLVLLRNEQHLRLFCPIRSCTSSPTPNSANNLSDNYQQANTAYNRLKELPKNPVFQTKPRSSGEPVDFVDFRRVTCRAGNGGTGAISFLREYNVCFGGPDGGNGGNGGHIIFKADSKTSDLSHVNTVLKGQSGEPGMGKCCHGKSGEHLYIPVPLNTLIRKPDSGHSDPEEDIIHELAKDGDIFIAARGGAGGHGNNFYVSNMVRKPTKAEQGGTGELVAYDVEMRTMAIGGLVGFPNAGKSTLLRAISRAKPKVACYPFTTLKPHVGMVFYEDFVQVPVADIPGIVENAHQNYGLGFSFLRHISRCECIFYVIDFTLGDLRDQFELLRRELDLYSPKFREKESAIVVNKIDLAKDEESEIATIQSQFSDQRVFFVSAKKWQNLEPMLVYLRDRYENFVKKREKQISEQDLNSLM